MVNYNDWSSNALVENCEDHAKLAIEREVTSIEKKWRRAQNQMKPIMNFQEKQELSKITEGSSHWRFKEGLITRSSLRNSCSNLALISQIKQKSIKQVEKGE